MAGSAAGVVVAVNGAVAAAKEAAGVAGAAVASASSTVLRVAGDATAVAREAAVVGVGIVTAAVGAAWQRYDGDAKLDWAASEVVAAGARNGVVLELSLVRMGICFLGGLSLVLALRLLYAVLACVFCGCGGGGGRGGARSGKREATTKGGSMTGKSEAVSLFWPTHP